MYIKVSKLNYNKLTQQQSFSIKRSSKINMQWDEVEIENRKYKSDWSNLNIN